MRSYDHKKIEAKWQKEWEKVGLYQTEEDPKKPKCYVLDMFPYPSGDGLHVGHPKGYIATDVYSRFKRMTGHNVLHPMGWDAFGLPAEQYALKNKVHPRAAVEKNVARFKEQLARIGFNYDWSREVNTTDPEFYKWTQWIFKQLFKAGLAYESNEPINWCPVDKTGLSNEDLENGRCERCGSVVEKRAIRQWVLKITKYADRMLEDLPGLNWPESIKESQRNWIGKSEGAEIEFALRGIKGQEDDKHKVKVFTTRPDTLFGATYLAISHELATKWLAVGWQASDAVKKFVTELEADEKEREFDFKEVAEKKGIDTGIKAVNPANGKEIPVWIANYVLSGYGTGAIMAVPAHDERDFDFASKFELPIVVVIKAGISDLRGAAVFLETPDGKLIFQERDEHAPTRPNMIALFGGGSESGESDIDCALRELREEVGLTLNKQDLTFVGSMESHSVPNKYHSVFHAQQIDLSKIVVHEGRGAISLSCEEALANEKITPFTKEAIRILGGEKLGAFSAHGELINSGKFSGLASEEAKRAITESVGGKMMSQYRLKDWVFARQRYWGEPFPIVFDADHKAYVVADSELPVKLPDVKAYEPTDTGESPLANIRDWVEVYGYLNGDGEFVSCKKDDPKAKLFTRETNTMPQWAGSSWYYLRYIDPTNASALVDKAKEKVWSPVDFYVGGAEHATRHLIYARFWHKFLYDQGIVNYTEPFLRLQNVGLIMAQDGRKMSKRYGNVINPDDIVETFGADSLRVYEMFMGPFDQSIAWSTDNMMGARRFIERLWRLSTRVSEGAAIGKEATQVLHQTIKKVGEDIERFSFNTAIAALMTMVNQLEKEEVITREAYRVLLKLIAPFAPHVADELWGEHGDAPGSIYLTAWPKFDDAMLVSDEMIIAVQVNGKLRDTFSTPRDTKEEAVKEMALKREGVQKWITGNDIKKVIYVPGKLVSIVL